MRASVQSLLFPHSTIADQDTVIIAVGQCYFSAKRRTTKPFPVQTKLEVMTHVSMVQRLVLLVHFCLENDSAYARYEARRMELIVPCYTWQTVRPGEVPVEGLRVELGDDVELQAQSVSKVWQTQEG
eukprot:1141674-Pelagomonas_calceolata.AAC.2